MSEPEIAAKAPFKTDVKAGKTYFWCTCGKSTKQPFCDGSHTGSDFQPLKYEADKDALVYFCGCKHTAKAPLCDGAHNKL